MERAIFEYDDYKSFTMDRIEAYPNAGRGIRAKLAEAIGCQVAYVSHVLAADRHFNLEQAEALARFFGLGTDETEYLLLLVEENRAGTTQLRRVLRAQLERRREKFRQLRNRVKLKGQINREDQARYYSSWHFQAVHTALTISECHTAPALQKTLGIPLKRVNAVLSFLQSRGLVEQQGNHFVPTERYIHLGADSPLISKLHSNWRIHAVESLDRDNPEDLHYSGVVTLAHSDFQKVREILMKGLLEAIEAIKPSKEERVCVVGLDFYQLSDSQTT